LLLRDFLLTNSQHDHKKSAVSPTLIASFSLVKIKILKKNKNSC
jgi:hypothetical protein